MPNEKVSETRLKVSAFGHSDPGQQREINEDTIVCKTESGLFILADGMGGHSAGKKASERAAETIEDYLSRWRLEKDFVWPFDPDPKQSDLVNHVGIALRVANVRVYNDAQRSENLTGMGTTGLVVLKENQTIVVGHVGDSRCYRYDDAGLVQITEDHSLVNQLMRAFALSESEAVEKAGKNVLVQSIGIDDDLVPQVQEVTFTGRSKLLMCSDGLTDMLSDKEIKDILSKHSNTLKSAVNELINRANEKGGSDNISVILIQLETEVT